MRSEKIRKNDLCYFVAIAILIFCNMSNISTLIRIPHRLYLVLEIVCILLFVFKIIGEKYTRKEIVMFILLGLIFALTSIQLGDYSFVINFFAIMALKNTSLRTVVQIDIAIKLFFLLLHGFFYLLNYFFAFASIEHLISETVKGVTYNLYFTNPNAGGGLIFYLLLDILYIKKQVKWKDVLISFLFIMFCFFITKSRTPVYIFVLFVFLFFLYRRMKKETFEKWITFFSKNSLLFLALFSFAGLFLGLQYGFKPNSFLTKVDLLFSNRFRYSVLAYQSYGGGLLPNKNSIPLESTFIIDNFYIRCFLSYGLTLLLALLFYTRKIPKKGYEREKIILILFSIYLFFELFSIHIGRALPLLIITNCIINPTRKDDLHENKKLHS